MGLLLPEQRAVLFSVPKSKSTVTQLVSKAVMLQEATAVKHLKGLLVSSGKHKVYVTAQAKDTPESELCIALSEQSPTVESFNEKDLTIKKWLRASNNPIGPADVVASWRGNLSFLEEDRGAKINGLRQPQLGALYSILGHLKLATEAGIVVLPTGTGKTETMLAALIANQCRRLLVVVPSDALRTQISEKFITLGLLKEFKVLAEDAAYPAVGVIRKGFASATEFQSFVAKSNVIVATMAILKKLAKENLEHLAAECSHLFIDEAHHVKAKSWEYVKEHFDNKKIIQFTATPFRNDGQRLEGKVLFNFPLREAQSQGYYKKIEFLAVSVPKLKEADKAIARAAVDRLRADLSKQHNHILMARCATKDRANEVFKLYEQETDLQPVLLYSGAPQAKENYQKILKKQARIIVCVDMLGEGFDLPELKIAAFHDIRKSLPITLQLAGRFTRTKFDEELGEACFIANIADPNVTDELEDLYARNPDWNKLLANMSQGRIEEEVDFKKLLAGFPKFADAPLPLNNIKVKMSAVAYKNKTDTWNPRNFKKGLPDYEKAFYKFDDLNSEEQLLIIITANQGGVEWLEAKEVYELTWRIIVVYWETRNNLLFIHSSDNSSLYEELAAAVTDNNAEIINKMNVFKTFDGMHRILLQNVGLRNWVGKDLQFRMMMGRDLEQAISLIEKQKGEKAFVMGTGYENGKKKSHGASYKGRIWMKRDNDLSVFKKWCNKIGGQLLDTSIDPNQFLKETLIPTTIDEFPKNMAPVWIDWHESLYDERETYYKFSIGREAVDLSALAIELGEATQTTLQFSIATDTQEAVFQFEFVQGTRGNDTFSDYQITQLTGSTVTVGYGRSSLAGTEFFKRYPPTFRLADGASISGNDYLQIKHPIGTFDKAAIEAWDWTGVDTSKESQRVEPRKDSVQYHVIQRLMQQDYDFIYDDDGSGEMADVVTLKVLNDRIQVELYHLKYAKKGKVSKGVGNFYEVCGQAQRSTHWKHKSGDALILHLLRRNPKTEGDQTRNRLEKGDLLELESLKLQAKKQLPLEFSIIIVQPSLSKAAAPEEILKLLGVTQNFAQELAGASLRVIGSK